MALVKKILIGLVLTIGLLLGIGTFAGFPPSYILAAPGVGTGIGAKLLCSSRYVSEFSQQQSFDDLVQYSPVLQYLSVEYNDSEKSVTTSLFGLSEKTASYLPLLGCSVEYEDFEKGRVQGLSLLDSGDSQPELMDWPQGDRIGPLNEKVQAFVESKVREDNQAGLNTRAMLVAHDGVVVAEAYDQETDAETKLLGWSMAKSLNSVMIGNLQMRGMLDVSTGPDFESWHSDERSQITLENMLNMTDGLGFSEEYNPGDDATAMLFTEPSAANYVLQKPVINTPGDVFNYSSGTANLLGLVYQQRTGNNLQDSFQDFYNNIYQAFSFQDAIFETDASGVFVASSYFYASARDWARLGQLMLNRGQINNQRIITEDWVVRATSPNLSANEKAYGYQWWLNSGDEQLRWPDLPADTFAAQGNRQQWIIVVPSQQLVFVRLGWTAGRYPINDHVSALIENL